jgi:hypothetical protein
MKRFLTLACLVFVTAATAQSAELAGIYMLKKEVENGVMQHKMVLDEEGTFLFSSFFSPHDREGKMLEIKSMYGSGKWRTTGNQVIFVVDRAEDFDEDRILDFSSTRARIQELRPGDTDGKPGPTQLVFIDSNIGWIKGLILSRQ